MSALTDALIINAVVLTVVLEADLGPHRKIGWFRLTRPLITSAVVVPFFVEGVTLHGTGVLVEVIATVAGLLLGLAAGALMKVYRSPRAGKPVSRSGLGYAALWTVVIAARAVFSYGSTNWFGPQLGHWMATNSVSPAAITDSLIFMALAMLIARTVSLGVHAMNLPSSPAQSHPAPVLQHQA